MEAQAAGDHQGRACPASRARSQEQPALRGDQPPDDPEAVYHFYCGRGDVENRLKELHHGLEMDRTSCSGFLANQFRVLLTLAAYILFQELRRRAAGTALADTPVASTRGPVVG